MAVQRSLDARLGVRCVFDVGSMRGLRACYVRSNARFVCVAFSRDARTMPARGPMIVRRVLKVCATLEARSMLGLAIR